MYSVGDPEVGKRSPYWTTDQSLEKLNYQGLGCAVDYDEGDNGKNGHFCQKYPSWGLEKRHVQCRYQKSETTFIRQTIPKNEVYDLWFHFWPLLHAFLGDFHFLALLGPILEGKSDQN